MARLAVAVLGLLAAGCVSTGELALVTRSGANPTELITGAHPYEEVGLAHARACRYFVLAVIPFGDAAFSSAVEEALASVDGDALLNATVSSSLFGFIPYYNVFAYTCTSVNGMAIRFRDRPGKSES